MVKIINKNIATIYSCKSLPLDASSNYTTIYSRTKIVNNWLIFDLTTLKLVKTILEVGLKLASIPTGQTVD